MKCRDIVCRDCPLGIQNGVEINRGCNLSADFCYLLDYLGLGNPDDMWLDVDILARYFGVEK